MLKFGEFCNTFTGFDDHELNESNLMEASAMSSIVKKNGFKVFSVKTVDDFFDVVRDGFGKSYSDDGKYAFHVYSDQIRIFDTTNAMRTGQSCVVYWIADSDRTKLSIVNGFDRRASFESFLTMIAQGDTKDRIDPEYMMNVTSGTYKEKAMKVFTPFALGNLKRVKSLPNRVSISHVMKLIANGQFSYLGRDYKHTDDYSYDNASNFGVIDGANPLVLIEKMFEMKWNTPSRFENEAGKTVLQFGPHMNESWTLVVDLNKKLRLKG